MSRLPYHRFGLLDTAMAAMLLTGGGVHTGTFSPEQRRLLQLMGYGPQYHDPGRHQQVRKRQSHQGRTHSETEMRRRFSV